MVTAQRVISVARQEIGTKEYPPGSNRQKYGKWYGWNGVPWCAIWVSWVFDRAGMPLPAIQHEKGFAYCPYGVKWFQERGKFFHLSKPGDIAFFDWQGDGVADHVGIVESVGNGFVTTIEGNTSATNNSNGGQVQRRRRLLRSIQGFARPDYQDDGKPGWSGRYLRFQSPMLRGADVANVQQKLIEKGFSVGKAGADGWYGADTLSAVRLYQASEGLEVDGVVGPNTWNRLFDL